MTNVSNKQKIEIRVLASACYEQYLNWKYRYLKDIMYPRHGLLFCEHREYLVYKELLEEVDPM